MELGKTGDGCDGQPLIALYLRYLFNTGIEPVTLNLARGLIKRGLRVDLVLNKVGGGYADQIPPGVRVVDLKSPHLPTGIPVLVRYLRRERPVALLSSQHFTNETAMLARLLTPKSTRFVVCEHVVLSQDARNSTRFKERLMPLTAGLTYRWADGIVAVSHGVAQDLAQITRLQPERIRVIYNPVLTPELQAKAREPLDHPWFAPNQPPVIVGVGRLRAQKDFATLIRAFARVRQSRPARLLILGNGPEKVRLLELVQQLGLQEDVALPGFVQNPYAYLARAAVFTLSSAWEGLPTVLIEAMAVGVPVIATDCPSGPAEILEGGRYGVLVPVGNSEAMAEAILGVLAGQAKRADPLWLEQFTLDTAVEHYLQVLGVTP